MEDTTIPDLDCSICKEKFCRPVRLPCNHVLCFVCLHTLISYETQRVTDRTVCTICRAPIDTDILDTDVIDEALETIILNSFDEEDEEVEIRKLKKRNDSADVFIKLIGLGKDVLDIGRFIKQLCAKPQKTKHQVLNDAGFYERRDCRLLAAQGHVDIFATLSVVVSIIFFIHILWSQSLIVIAVDVVCLAVFAALGVCILYVNAQKVDFINGLDTRKCLRDADFPYVWSCEDTTSRVEPARGIGY